MFRHHEYEFHTNTVITSEQMQTTSHYAGRMLMLLYAGYSEGIITGSQISIEDDFISVSPGIIKHDNMLYHMEEKERIHYEHTGRKTYLRLRFLDARELDDGFCYDTELVLSEDERLFPYEMELGRFLSEQGARLRIDDGGFETLATDYNYFDIRNVPYASIGESTIPPQITYAFAKEMEGKKDRTMYDIAFCLQCLTKMPVDREVIYGYISAAREKSVTALSNDQIYHELLTILNERTTGRQPPQNQMRSKKFIVD